MTNRSDREILDQLLDSVRKRIFFKTTTQTFVRACFLVLPGLTLIVAGNQRCGDAGQSGMIVLMAFTGLAAFSALRGLLGLGAKVRSALAVDESANLKDRITSAYEFLAGEKLDEPRVSQIHDAIRHARAVNSGALFRFQWPRHSAYLGLGLLVLSLTFFIPAALPTQTASAASDDVKQLQLAELKDLQEQLAAQPVPDKELKDVLEKLKDIQKRFEQGELSERDVMLELARLDEDMRQKASELGVENLEGEMNTIVPHLMSSAAAVQVASALKENQLDKANEELQKLSANVKEKKISKGQKRELALNMGVAASKLGGKKNASFGGDFSKASEALEKDDTEGFESACQSVGDKLCLMKKARTMKLASKKIGNCKSCLGQCDSKEFGYTLGPKSLGNKKGGLKAGTAASGNPLGEASRLADSYRNMIRVTGQAGQGPVETETEITEGQLSQSQRAVKELHANFAAVAEEAIENEAIPLSHRQHVKKYFQSIRPQE